MKEFNSGALELHGMAGFWELVIRPLLETIGAKTVVEVGAAEGYNTINLLAYCAAQNGYLHVVDPTPQFDEVVYRQQFGLVFSLHRDLSLRVLPRLGRFEAILIDGDHNWYTVFNELKEIEAAHLADPTAYPLVFLHDIDWPYGRRDTYYNPETIPPEYRHNYTRMGILPGQSHLSPVNGLNGDAYNAIYEGQEKNGVLTAVEDFITGSDLEFEFIPLRVGFGLGILVTTERRRLEGELDRRLAEVIGQPTLAALRARLSVDPADTALQEQITRPYQLNLRPALSNFVATRREGGPAATRPYLSIVVVLHNIRREAERTLYSLSACYQQEVDEADYEVVVIENGSTEPLEDTDLSRFGPNFRYHYLSTTSRSPARAINTGASLAQGEYLGIIIDGAHLLTPGIIKYAGLAFELFANPVAAVRSCYLGPGQQQLTIHQQGYNQQAEDALLNEIGWPQDGYRLFEIGELYNEYYKLGWFHPLYESSCLLVKRQLFTSLGGYDESFQQPGGGLAGPDFFVRALETPNAALVVILGEATFHQVHGGVTTNVTLARASQLAQEFYQEYATIRQRPFAAPTAPIHYLGHMPPRAVASFDMVKNREFDRMAQELAAKEDEIRLLAGVCAEREDLINRLSAICAEREALINRLSAVCAERETLINQLSSKT